MTTPSQPTNNNDPLSQAINQMLANYQSEMTEIANLQAAGDSETQLQAQLAQLEAALQDVQEEGPPPIGPEGYQVWYEEIQELRGRIATIQTQITAQQSTITTLETQIENLDPGFTSMANTLNSLLATFGQLALSGQATSNADWSQFESYLNQVFTAAKQQAQADYQAALMQQEENNPADQNSSETTAQYITAELAEASTMESLQGTLANDLGTYNEALNSAQADASGIHWYDFWESTRGDDAIEQNATAMEDTIASLLSTIAPLTTSSSADMIQVDKAIKDLLADVRQILQNPNLNGMQKLTQVLALMMSALTLISEAQGDFTSDKENIRQKMADATIQASQIEIVDSTSMQEELANELQYASVMGSLMQAVQIIMGTIMSIMAPGLGSFLAMAAITILQATGEIDKLTSALASAIGSQVGADAIMAAIEAVVTFGGGAVVDEIVTTAMKSAIKAAAKATETVVQQAVEAAVTKAVELSGNAVQRGLAKAVIENAVETAVEEAGRKTLLQFMKQGIVSLLGAAAKGMGANGVNSLEQLAENTMATAAKQAAEKAVPFAEKVLLGGVLSDGELEELEEIGEKASDQAVADATLTTEEKVAKSTVEKSFARIFGEKITLGFVIAAGQTNLLVDLASALQKASGKSTDDSWFQDLQYTLQALQMVAGIVAQMYAGQAVTLQGGTLASKVAAFTTLVEGTSMGMQTVASAGKADAYGLQAEAVRAIAENQSDLDVLQMTQKQIAAWAAPENDRDMQQLASDLQMSTQVSLHLWDSRDALAQVLAAQAI
ncbi:MAG: hypothetical protein HY861_03175 [Chlamydiia bacterium]|nr:hypothetical protein [Chlamydiia bacterium]